MIYVSMAFIATLVEVLHFFPATKFGSSWPKPKPGAIGCPLLFRWHVCWFSNFLQLISDRSRIYTISVAALAVHATDDDQSWFKNGGYRFVIGKTQIWMLHGKSIESIRWWLWVPPWRIGTPPFLLFVDRNHQEYVSGWWIIEKTASFNQFQSGSERGLCLQRSCPRQPLVNHHKSCPLKFASRSCVKNMLRTDPTHIVNYPICSMYGLFTYKTRWFWTRANVGKCIFQHHGELIWVYITIAISHKTHDISPG